MALLKKILALSTLLAIALCMFSVRAVAETADANGTVSYEQIKSNGTNGTNDANVPKSYHNLDSSDYYYDGSVHGRIYTLKYFNPTGDGKLYIEGFAENFNIVEYAYQNVVIELYELETKKCVGKFELKDDSVLTRQPTFSVFYYNFYIYNLDPNKFYYFGFINSEAPVGLNINGYISHHATYYFWDDVHGDNSVGNELLSENQDIIDTEQNTIKMHNNAHYQEIIDEMRKKDALELFEHSKNIASSTSLNNNEENKEQYVPKMKVVPNYQRIVEDMRKSNFNPFENE